MKKTYERLSWSNWTKVDDFVPLLAVNETKIRKIQIHQRHIIRNRIYLFNEYFSVITIYI